MTASYNVGLVLAIMDRLTAELWDDEGFRTVHSGPSFGEVRSLLDRLSTERTAVMKSIDDLDAQLRNSFPTLKERETGGRERQRFPRSPKFLPKGRR